MIICKKKYIVLTFWIVVILYCFYRNYIDEFFFTRFSNYYTAYIKLVINDHLKLEGINLSFFDRKNYDSDLFSIYDTINASNSLYLFHTYLFLSIYYLTGLEVQSIMLFPIGSFILPLSFIFFTKKISGHYMSDNNLTYLYLIYIILYIIPFGYSLFYVGASAEYILFILMGLTINIFKDIKFKELFIYFLLLLCITQCWHTLNLMYITFLGITFLIYVFIEIMINRQYFKIVKKTIIVLTSFIITILFSYIWQSYYFTYFVSEFTIPLFIEQLINKFIGRKIVDLPYLFNYKSLFLGQIYYISLLLTYLLSFIILIYSLIYIIRTNNIKQLKNNLIIILSISIIITQIVVTLLYSGATSINFYYVPLFFPIIGISNIINNKNKNNIKIFQYVMYLLIFFTILNISISYYTNDLGQTSLTKYSDTKTSFFYFNKYQMNNNVITDFNLISKFIQRQADFKLLNINYIQLSHSFYKDYLNKQRIDKKYSGQYFIIDYKTIKSGLPFHIYESRGLLIPQLKIMLNKQNNFVYNDNKIAIIKIQ